MVPAKKKLLIVTFDSPYPAVHGGSISIFGSVNYLRSFFDITLVFRVFTRKQIQDAEELKKIWKNVAIKYISYYPLSSFSLRIRNLAYVLFKKVKQIGKRLDKNPELQKIISNPVIAPLDGAFISHLEKIFSENKFDIIQVEHSCLINIIHILPKDSIRIFVQIEGQFLMLNDLFFINKDESLYARYLKEHTRFSEDSLISQYDYIFALNQSDAANIRKICNKDNVFVTPFPIPDSLTVNTNIGEWVPDKLLFMGHQTHYPNMDAVEWFIEKIYVSAYRQSGLKLYITGYWKKRFIRKYKNVKFTGFVDDLSAIMKNSLVICPIRIGGGGLRAKVIHAMSMGCPVIATKGCCEGMEGLVDGMNILFADNEPEFIFAIKKLTEDKKLRNLIIKNGKDLIVRNYSEKTTGEIRRNIYCEILKKE